MTHTHTLAEWAAMVSAAVSGFATFSVFYFLLVEASLDPRPALRDAGDRALVEIVRAKNTVRDIPRDGRRAPHAPHRHPGGRPMNRIRLYWHRLTRRPAVRSPHRLYIRRIPTGAMLDVEAYLIDVLKTLADNPDLRDMLDEIAADRREARAHDGWEPEELLVEQLTAALGYELPLYGDAAGRLADRLRAVAPVPAVGIPAQRPEGSAA